MDKQVIFVGVGLFGAGILAGTMLNSNDSEPSTEIVEAEPSPISTAAMSAPPPASTEDVERVPRFPTDPVSLDVDSIRSRVSDLDLTESENVWARIPWVPSLEEAQRLSHSSGRPIFFFSMYGELDGRC